MFPQLSDIEPKIAKKLKSRGPDIQTSSKLNCWIRLISGAVISSDNKGLILQSIQTWEPVSDKTLDASYYGFANSPLSPRAGTLGNNMQGVPQVAGIGRQLRPSPIVTSLSIKEGQDQISRECTIEVKCFSLGQLEKLQTYLMEPGYSLYVEYGWNTKEGLTQPLDISKNDVNYIVGEAANRGLNYDYLHSLREKSAGDFDCILGFITGAQVSSEGETFTLTINLRGQPGLPTYLQSQHQFNPIQAASGSANENKVTEAKTDPKYNDSELEIAGNSADIMAKRRFKTMFNALPPIRQTDEVKEFENKVKLTDFINFDNVVQQKIVDYQDVGWLQNVAATFGWGEGSTIKIKNSSGGEALVDKTKLFSKNRYIRFGLAIDILNANGKVGGYNVGGKNVSIEVNIDNSIIGAFPYMFSTNPDKLIIPGVMPDFSAYFLNANTVTQGCKISDDKFAAEILIVDEKFNPIDNFISTYQNGDEIISFAQNKKLDANVTENIDTNGKVRFNEEANYWGFLKNLYINFDVFYTKIVQSNKVINEILLDMLNEMASAANGFWNFQLVETKCLKDNKSKRLKKGDIILSVIDENFVGQPTKSEIQTFFHAGIESPFLESKLDLSIPAEMANKIILTRLKYTSQPHSPSMSVGKNSFFNSATDVFMTAINKKASVGNAKNEQSAEGATSAETANDIKQKDAKQLSKSSEENIKKLKEKYKPKVEYEASTSSFSSKVTTTYKFDDKNIQQQFDNELKNEEKAQKDWEAAGGSGSVKDANREDSNKQALNTVGANLNKVDVVPKINIADMTALSEQYLKNVDELKKRFRIFCLRDEPYFDVLKQNAYADKMAKNNGSLSQPLPITYEFTTLGISGLRRGDMFKIEGIPSKYRKQGVFQITELEQNVTDLKWTTRVVGKYRQLI